MKKILSLLLIAAMAMMLFACGGSMNPAETALIAVKKLDLEAFSASMTADSETALSRLKTAKAALDASETETLTRLYAMITYTMGEENESDQGKTVSLTVKLPDMARIITLTEKKSLVSAQTAEEIVSEMLESGEIAAAYMLEKTWELTVCKEDGAWKLPYTDKANAALVNDLALAEMFSLFTIY